MQRRQILVAAALSLAAPRARPQTPPSVEATTSIADSEALDAMVRLRGRRKGELWFWLQGDVFGRMPEETLRPLVGFCSVLRMRYRPDPERGYRFEQRESAHFYDVATGEPLGEFANPYTGKTNIAVAYVSPRFEFRLDESGVYAGRRFDQLQGTVPRGLETDGRDVWTTEVRYNEYRTGLPEDEFPEVFVDEIRRSKDIATYRAPIASVADAAIEIVPAAVSFVADLPWLQWMLMGRRAGHAFWYGQGSKCAERSQIPPAVTQRVDRIHPGFLDDPWGIDGEPYGTVYQMRRLRRAGKI